MRPRQGFTLVELPVVSKRRRFAFTLVELLVVIAIIGILVGLLLPAVQAAREAARKKQCMNNMRQMAVAYLNHESSHHYFPTGGWGNSWIGQPDVGYDAYQPGSWAYNILAYMEHGNLRDLGTGFSDQASRETELLKLVTMPLAIFHCPSKRRFGLFPFNGDELAKNLTNCRGDEDCEVVRGDYRANAGNYKAFSDISPPLVSGVFGPLEMSQWKTAYKPFIDRDEEHRLHNGITYKHSMVRVQDITDGTSSTAIIGEKRLNVLFYDVYEGAEKNARDDDQCLYSGFDRDNQGLTGDEDGILPPMQDRARENEDTSYLFGSAHPDGFHMAFCDGSVRLIDYEVNSRVFLKFGGRNDEF